MAPTVATIALGSSSTFSAQAMNADGVAIPGRALHWSSENAAIASVSAEGVVTAHQVGTVLVAASAEGQSGMAQVNITEIPVASVEVTPGNLAMLVGTTSQLVATALDNEGRVLSGRPIIWSSNNPAVATVSADGLVTALAPGGAIMSATAEGKVGLASVTSAAMPVAAVNVSPDSQRLVVGQGAQFKAEVLDEDGEVLPGRHIEWSTSQEEVVSVSSSGMVTARGSGKAIVWATSEGHHDSTVVEVSDRPRNAVIIAPAQAVVIEGSTIQLNAFVFDDQGRLASDVAVSFSSASAAVAAVTAGGLVTGVSPGTALITATAGSLSGSALVTVDPVPVGSVTVSPSSVFLVSGKTVQLDVEIRGVDGAVIQSRKVRWRSTAPTVATVTSAGVVRGRGPGSAVIFASVDGVTGWAKVTVALAPVKVAGTDVRLPP